MKRIEVNVLTGESKEIEMTADEIAALPGPQSAPIQQEVTMRQARLALLAAGKLADVNTAIDAMPEPDRTAARIEWEYSGSVRRHQPFVLQLAPAIGLDSAGLDALFIDAAQR